MIWSTVIAERGISLVDILFVHGIGARGAAYENTLRVVREQASRYLPAGIKVLSCPWGDDYGASLNLGGASIPSESPGPFKGPREVPWGLLYADPLLELRMLAQVPSPVVLRPGESPGEQCISVLRTFEESNGFRNLLGANSAQEIWAANRTVWQGDSAVLHLIRQANRTPPEMSGAIARALFASLWVSVEARQGPVIDRNDRDEMVASLVSVLGGETLGGVMSWVFGPLVVLAGLAFASEGFASQVRDRRDSLSNAISPFAGDVVMYQARGEAICGFIGDQIARASGQVVLLAHSLGSIASIDLLVRRKDLVPKVRAIVTLGSQVPVFYEINALRSLEFGKSLPSDFPKLWLNFYDPSDFLSYIGEPVFPGAVEDIKIQSEAGFPASHSSYWRQGEFWKALSEKIQWQS